MQTPKARSGTSEAPPRVSPRSTTTTARKLRPTPLDTDSTSSSATTAAKTPPSTKTPNNRSPKTIERKSPRSPVPEKRRPSKLLELETQIARLREELEQAKQQLRRSESEKKQSELDGEESKKHASALSEKLEESEKKAKILSEKLEESREHLREVSGGEEGRLAELSRISDERDEARRCELETATRRHSVDSAALAAALDEARWLRVELETAVASEAEQASRAEEMKARARECEESEAQARGLARETLTQLEAAKSAVESLRARVGFLEGLVGPDQPNLGSAMEDEIRSMVELEELRGRLAEALASVEVKVEETRARVQLEVQAEVEELRGRLMDRETEAQGIAEENEALKAELRVAVRERKAATEEAERGRERAEAARAEIGAVEAEMRRVRVQSDQWRKAAEAAAAMLSGGGGGGKVMERTGSLDGSFYSPGPAPKFGSIFGDDAVAAEDEDDLLKKKNGNVLKKIGVLWKKPQK